MFFSTCGEAPGPRALVYLVKGNLSVENVTKPARLVSRGHPSGQGFSKVLFRDAAWSGSNKWMQWRRSRHAVRPQGRPGVASGAGRLRIQNIDLTERRCGRSKTFRPPDLIMCLEGIPGVSHSNMSVLGKTNPHSGKACILISWGRGGGSTAIRSAP